MYVHEKMNDLSNCAQDDAQACACMASAPKPNLRERLEALCSLVELAAAGTIRSTTIQTVDHGKASISVSAKGTIKVARIEARACQLEA